MVTDVKATWMMMTLIAESDPTGCVHRTLSMILGGDTEGVPLRVALVRRLHIICCEREI